MSVKVSFLGAEKLASMFGNVNEFGREYRLYLNFYGRKNLENSINFFRLNKVGLIKA